MPSRRRRTSSTSSSRDIDRRSSSRFGISPSGRARPVSGIAPGTYDAEAMGRSIERPLLERMQRRHPRFKDAVLADFRLQRRALGHRRYDPKSKLHTLVDMTLLFF